MVQGFNRGTSKSNGSVIREVTFVLVSRVSIFLAKQLRSLFKTRDRFIVFVDLKISKDSTNFSLKFGQTDIKGNRLWFFPENFTFSVSGLILSRKQ